MKALSLKQPWAYLIFHGKDVENRQWNTKYRGPLLIHSSLRWDKEGELWIKEHFPKILPEVMFYPQGVILGRVEMIDCVTSYPSPWFFGPFGFVFLNPIKFKKEIPWKGKLNLFEIPNTFFMEE